MDRMLAIIILFLGAMILTAAVVAMGAVPAIFTTKDLVNQTLLIQHAENQSMRQMQHEDIQRFIQSSEIRNNTKDLLEEHDNKVRDYIMRENNTTNRILEELKNNTSQNIMILKNQEKVMAQHNKISKDHDRIQDLVKNVTMENNEMLKHVLQVLNTTH